MNIAENVTASDVLMFTSVVYVCQCLQFVTPFDLDLVYI